MSNKRSPADLQEDINHRESSPLSRDFAGNDFSDIYLRFRDNVLRVAYSVLHDEARAADVVHDVFIKFIVEQGTIETPEHWLVSVARKLALNVSRDEKLHDEKLRNVYRWLKAHEYSPDMASAIDASRIYDIAFMRDGCFSTVERRVLQLMLDDTPPARIARDLGLPESTARDTKKRVVAKLRDLLGVTLKEEVTHDGVPRHPERP